MRLVESDERRQSRERWEARQGNIRLEKVWRQYKLGGVAKSLGLSPEQFGDILNGGEVTDAHRERIDRHFIANNLDLQIRGLLESELCAKVAHQLSTLGFRADTEHRLHSGRRVDIVAFNESRPIYIIEAKVENPLHGIGQVLADYLEMDRQGKPVLLLRSDTARCRITFDLCAQLGIEIWVERFKGKQQRVAGLNCLA